MKLSIDEMHELTTSISVANIKVLLHRGRKNLYARLGRWQRTKLFNPNFMQRR